MSTLISEKAAEILFCRHMLQWLGLGNAQLFAPTTRKEYESGYDSKIVGSDSMREIYLQFKAPTYSERDRRFTCNLTEHQHLRLRNYPNGTAFYVAAYFKSLDQFNNAQSSTNTTEDFLRNYICIDVKGVADDARCLTFCTPSTMRHSLEPGYKDSRHSNSPKSYTPIESMHCKKGNLLISLLKQEKVGRLIDLRPAGSTANCTNIASALDLDAELPVHDFRDCGVFVRIIHRNQIPKDS
jgi:hypothetical protein